ncbi:tyrosine-protein kinase SRK2-like isoform X1 [Clavelina lepadiformis]|uniref:tyrosine-protein kinase SRK2-like isoform X1 n=1 Tax=Clavelina lepadiformis TaxID=159417 RepID=UPI004042438A
MGKSFSSLKCCKCSTGNLVEEDPYEMPTGGTPEKLTSMRLRRRSVEENVTNIGATKESHQKASCGQHWNESNSFQFEESIYETMEGIANEHLSNPNVAGYHGKINREEAERRLLGPDNLNYSFLIRENKDNTAKYVLSVRLNSNQDGVHHQRIMQNANGSYGLHQSEKSFAYLEELVEFYQKNQSDWYIRLSTPCVPAQGQPTCSGFFCVLDKWEIERKRLDFLSQPETFMRFKEYNAKWSKSFDLAVRQINEGMISKDEFHHEIKTMKTIQHANVVQVYGFCTMEQPYCIVTEYLPYLDLKEYLISEKGCDLPAEDLLYMGAQVACGMSYLENHKIVYGKLAARNIAVGDDNICKIADVGLNKLSREAQPRKITDAHCPDKWKAPEAYRKNRFTSQSDVWSFGILLMEIITKGDEPYLGYTDIGLLHKDIENGHRMDRPEDCPSALYDIMLECWDVNPQTRPSFADVYLKLKNRYMTHDNCFPSPPPYTNLPNSNSYENNLLPPPFTD